MSHQSRVLCGLRESHATLEEGNMLDGDWRAQFGRTRSPHFRWFFTDTPKLEHNASFGIAWMSCQALSCFAREPTPKL